LPNAAYAAKKSLRICYEDTSNPPLYYSIEQAKPGLPGVTIELLEQAAKSNGLQLKLIQIPWKRCLKALQSNLVDGAFDLSYKSERESFAVYPYAEGAVDQQRYLHELAYYLFTLKRSKVEWDGEKIHNLQGSLAGVSGYSIIDDLRTDGYTVDEGKNQLSNMQMLIRRRIEGVAQFATTTQNIMHANPELYRNVKQHPKPLRRKLYYLAYGKDFYARHTEIAEGIWDSLAELNGQGFSKQATKKYMQ
jgi:polar amino acid transport system substrate-binding protein